MSGPDTKHKPFTIALTGGIASGKTLVSDRFAALGVPVIDTDRIARDVVAPHTQGLAEIRHAFGKDVIDRNGHLDRRALRHIIVTNPRAKQTLEAITHPRIHAAMQSALNSIDHPYALVVVPLLLEAGWEGQFDRILVVEAAESLRRQRLISRDAVSKQQAQALMATQTSDAARRAVADDLIVNNGDPSQLDETVLRLHQRYLELAQDTG